LQENSVLSSGDLRSWCWCAFFVSNFFAIRVITLNNLIATSIFHSNMPLALWERADLKEWCRKRPVRHKLYRVMFLCLPNWCPVRVKLPARFEEDSHRVFFLIRIVVSSLWSLKIYEDTYMPYSYEYMWYSRVTKVMILFDMQSQRELVTVCHRILGL